MKYFFLFLLLLFLCGAAGAQGEFAGSRAVWQFRGVPNLVPNEATSSLFAIDIETRKLYGWDIDADEWKPIVADVPFDTTGLRNRAFLITTLADTANISPPPLAADMFVKDSTTFGLYTTKWNILQGGTGGTGGPTSWNDLTNVPDYITDGDDVGLETVSTDNSIDGDGTSGNPLGVSRFYVESIIDERIEVEYIYEAMSSGTTIVLPNLPDDRYPIKVYRTLYYTVDRAGGSAADFRLNGSTLTKNYGQITTGERWLIHYVKLL